MPHTLPPLNPMSEAPDATEWCFVVMLEDGQTRVAAKGLGGGRVMLRYQWHKFLAVGVDVCLGWWPIPAVKEAPPFTPMANKG